jgi:hypothetical protein
MKYKREYLEQFLNESADLQNCFVYFGMVNYVDQNGTQMMIMDDDDKRVEACIKFLTSIGAPNFHENGDEAKLYAKKLAENI